MTSILLLGLPGVFLTLFFIRKYDINYENSKIVDKLKETEGFTIIGFVDSSYSV